MSAKKAFLSSLRDEDLGYFHAYEFNDNLEELLCDRITMKQMRLFHAWKDEEKKGTVQKYPSFLDSPNFDKDKAKTLKMIIDMGRLEAMESFVNELPKYKPDYDQWKLQHSGSASNEVVPPPKPSEFPPFLDYLHLSKYQDISFRQLVTNKRWNVLDAWIDQKYPKYSSEYIKWKQAILTQN